MRGGLRVLLPLAIPLSCWWARRQQRRIVRQGRPLTGDEQVVARAVGIVRPEDVRVWRLPQWPLPMRWFSRHVSAMTLGPAIWSVEPLVGRLLVHELRHVQQAEAAGSLDAFIARYLRQVAQHGYWLAPMEVDARDAERRYSEVAGGPCCAR